jgi:hypothetical protein
MFDRIIIHQQHPNDLNRPVDLGFLVEAMVFYGDVYLLAHQAILRQLLRDLGPEVLIELLEEGYLRIGFEENNAGIRTEDVGGSERYEPVLFEIRSNSGTRYDLQQYAPEAFIESVGKPGRGRRLARRFLSLAQRVEIGAANIDEVRFDFADSEYLSEVGTSLLEAHVPDYRLPEPLRVELVREGELYRLSSNIDWRAAKAAYASRMPPEHSSLTPALLLSHMLNGIEMLRSAAERDAEFAVDPAHEAVVSARLARLIERRRANDTRLALFQDMVFDEARPIREAVNSRARGPDDILTLVARARKFRDWMRERPNDSDLLREYYQASVKETWADTLPAKTTRWAVFSGGGLAIDALGAGGIGSAVGLALSALDAFLLDRLLKGWKPSQFVEGELRSFVSVADNSGSR